MQHTNQYYFSVEKLENLIAEFRAENYIAETGNKNLKGFVFTPGYEPENGKPIVFAFPLFSNNERGGQDGDFIIQNAKVANSGCPYPPPCTELRLTDSCY